MITEIRKAQIKRAKRKYTFKQMLNKALAVGKQFSYSPEVLIDHYMNQPDETRLTAKVFLQRNCTYDVAQSTYQKTHEIPIVTNQEELVEMLTRLWGIRQGINFWSYPYLY